MDIINKLDPDNYTDKEINPADFTHDDHKEVSAKLKGRIYDLGKWMHFFVKMHGWIGCGYRSFQEYANNELKWTVRQCYRIANRHKHTATIKSLTRNKTEFSLAVSEEINKIPERHREKAVDKMIERSPTIDGSVRITQDVAREVVAETMIIEKEVDHPDLRPECLAAINEGKVAFRKLWSQAYYLKKQMEAVLLQPWSRSLHPQAFIADIQNIINQIKCATPYAPCPYCEQQGCKSCHDEGWVNLLIWNQTDKALQDQMIEFYGNTWKPSRMKSYVGKKSGDSERLSD